MSTAASVSHRAANFSSQLCHLSLSKHSLDPYTISSRNLAHRTLFRFYDRDSFLPLPGSLITPGIDIMALVGALQASSHAVVGGRQVPCQPRVAAARTRPFKQGFLQQWPMVQQRGCSRLAAQKQKFGSFDEMVQVSGFVVGSLTFKLAQLHRLRKVLGAFYRSGPEHVQDRAL